VPTSQDIATGGSFAGAAVKDIFTGFSDDALIKGYNAAAGGFDTAASLARQNAEIEKQSTAIKTMQAERQIYKTLGGQQADVAAAGFGASGSALDLLADSTRQGELTKHLITQQGQINVNNFQEQATAYAVQAEQERSKSEATKSSQMGSYISAGVEGAAALAMFL